jgi:hypothetical protein
MPPTEDLNIYIDRNNLSASSISIEDIKDIHAISSKTKALDHRLRSRSIILWPVVIITSVIPIWIMILITFSGLGNIKFSEKMQLSLLGAGVVDFLGLCYIVATDLYPKGRFKENIKSENNSKKEEEEI